MHEGLSPGFHLSDSAIQVRIFIEKLLKIHHLWKQLGPGARGFCASCLR